VYHTIPCITRSAIAGSPFAPLRQAANPHVGGHLSLWSTGTAPYLGGLVLIALIFFFVVLPAVWSRSPDRRQAAYGVLDRILRFFRR
jgi:hypothetical protein